MKIIKAGFIPKLSNRLLRFTCERCGCIFECETTECWTSGCCSDDPRTWTTYCPTCDYFCFAKEKPL